MLRFFQAPKHRSSRPLPSFVRQPFIPFRPISHQPKPLFNNSIFFHKTTTPLFPQHNFHTNWKKWRQFAEAKEDEKKEKVDSESNENPEPKEPEVDPFESKVKESVWKQVDSPFK